MKVINVVDKCRNNTQIVGKIGLKILHNYWTTNLVVLSDTLRSMCQTPSKGQTVISVVSVRLSVVPVRLSVKLSLTLSRHQYITGQWGPYTHWRIQKFWKGRGGTLKQCIVPLSFIANAHNELYAFYTRKKRLTEKVWCGLPLHHPQPSPPVFESATRLSVTHTSDILSLLRKAVPLHSRTYTTSNKSKLQNCWIEYASNVHINKSHKSLQYAIVYALRFTLVNAKPSWFEFNIRNSCLE